MTAETIRDAGRHVSTRSVRAHDSRTPAQPLDADVTVDDRARFARLDMPAAGLSVVREDLASVATRAADVAQPDRQRRHHSRRRLQPGRHADDAAGAAAACGIPAVVLVAGSGPVDRDDTVAGIPDLRAARRRARRARASSSLRYDKRGVGQSGGRTETATLRGLRRRRDRGRQVAGEARRRRPASGSSSPATARARRWRCSRRRARRRSRRSC